MGIFGSATDDDIDGVFEKVGELLADDITKASLGVENSLIIEDVNKNTTATDERSAGIQPTSKSQGISAGLKVGISFLALAGAAFAIVVIYRSSLRKGAHEIIGEGDEEEGLDGANSPLKTQHEESPRLA